MIVKPLSYNTQKLKVGIFYQGGIIVYVNSRTKQGLIVSDVDLNPASTFVSWQEQPYENVTTNSGYGEGLQNTLNIDASSVLTPAATLCLNYTAYGYSDWFLPSQEELLYVLQNKSILGISGGLYWTSYSQGFNTAIFVDMGNNSPYVGNLGSASRQYSLSSTPYAGYVRACRYITFT